MSVSPLVPSETIASKDQSSWLNRLDSLAERFGDAVNPILVKEMRQALKSRQFLVTFSALLLAALGWTVGGSMSLMPQIYTTPSAPRMIIGYYIVLAIPLLLVVPLAAYRSLEAEIDDGTLELLSITSLSPWQIVLGKLASASLQMMLYFVVLLPCVAYAYTLRGVDLPTILSIVGILLVAALLLTIIGLFFAPLARSRTGRIGTMLACMGILLLAQWGLGYFVIEVLIDEGLRLSSDILLLVGAATGLVSFFTGHLLLTATAAQLTPESENRSTPLRISLLMLSTTIVGLAAYGIQHDDLDVAMFSWSSPTIALALLWLVGASMMVAESPIMTPRIQRELPNSFLSRILLTWLTPGPATGLVFSVVIIAVLCCACVLSLELISQWQGRGGVGRAVAMFSQFSVLYLGYAMCFLVLVKWIVAIARLKSNPRADIGIATMIVVLVATSLIPFAVGLQANEFREYDYSYWQITNWCWTFGEAADRKLSGGEEYIILSAGIILFASCVISMPAIVLPRRIATPERVTEAKHEVESSVTP